MVYFTAMCYSFAEDGSDVLIKFKDIKPKVRSQNGIKNIIKDFKPEDRKIALTFDACDGSVDQKLIQYLRGNKIHATFFWTTKWINKNKEFAMNIARDPLFDIQNHGNMHKPCFVDGGSMYGIKAPNGIAGVINEIEIGNDTIQKIIGKKTKFYRSGTAYYDDVCVEIAKDLGYKIAGFSVIGDGGAKYTKKQIVNALLTAKSGDIIIMHMNHPEGQTAEGVEVAIPQLQKQGFRFILLKDLTTPLF